ncbi:hypothetical protein F4604DRAFT_1680078 [Suillus subluteus]|nr:hypothetical protein F4604DRAFT_1680078 [Suillus subluteus]
MPVSVTGCLSASLMQWLKLATKLTLLYDDLATWHSDLKKSVIAIVPSAYGLVPPADIPIQEHTAWVEDAAAKLLDDGNQQFFKKRVPLKCLVLICTAFHCVFQGLAKHGNDKLYPKFTAKEYESVYMAMLGLLEAAKNDPYHSKWARAGWAEASKLDAVDILRHHCLQVQLD